MKKILFLFMSLLASCGPVFAAPVTSMDVPNSFSPNTTISSSDMNENFNEVQSKFNTHTHTDITQVSTIVSGTWNGSTITVPYGGTGLTSVTQGDVLYGSASNTLSALTKNTSSTRYLSNTGTSNNPAWAQVALTTGVSGILPVANGGLGSTLLLPVANGGTAKDFSATAQGYVLYFNQTGAINALAPGTSGNVLTTGGASANPSWVAPGMRLLSTTTISSATNTGDITIAANKFYLVQVNGQVSSNADDAPVILINNDTTSGNYKDITNTSRANVGITSADGATTFAADGGVNFNFYINTFGAGAQKATINGDIVFDKTGAGFFAYLIRGVYTGGTPTSFRITNNRSFASLSVRVYEYGQ